MIKHVLVIILSILGLTVNAQSLTELLESDKPDTNYIDATFKSTRLINGQTIETIGKKELNAVINHRFETLNTGINQFYGLDQGATIRLGLEYGLTNKINIGLGRSNTEKLIDGYTKIKILRQCSGALNHPFSLSYYGGMEIKTEPWADPQKKYPLDARFSYVHELIIARKFNSSLSVEIIPGFVHRNMIVSKDDKNIVPYAGFGARCKITKRTAIIGEYYYMYQGKDVENFTKSMSFGYEIETGGHVFQIILTNSSGMTEKIFIPETNGKWGNGNIRIGFNIMRRFSI